MATTTRTNKLSARELTQSDGTDRVAPAQSFSEHAEDHLPGEQSSFERVRRGILRSLYEGRYAPGQRLAEPDLMQQFRVGRGTIREVFNGLATAGIVTLVRHRGASVVRLTRGEVNQLLDVVAIMFGLAARKAVERIGSDPDGAGRLISACEKLPRFEWQVDFVSFIRAREDFHRTVMRLSGNNELIKLFPAVKVHIMRMQLRPFERAADGLQLSDYKEITDAILSGNPDLAETIARAHVQHTTDIVKLVPDRAFEPE
jgi:DNA-binding GntR family transcriptional regulator